MFLKISKANDHQRCVSVIMGMILYGALGTVAAQQIRINDVTTTESVATQRFTITADSVPERKSQPFTKGGAVSLVVSTSNGTALAGQDYEQRQQTITIPIGATSATFDVTLIDDNINEGNETYSVTVSLPSPVTQKGIVTIVDGTGVGTIVDNDGAPPVATSVPTLDAWGLLLLMVSMVGFAAYAVHSRRNN